MNYKFALPTEKHLSINNYAISTTKKRYYLSADECEVLINGAFYIMEKVKKNLFYIRINGAIEHITIKKFNIQTMKPRTFKSSSLEQDYYSIPQMNRAQELSYEVKETKDRDQNKIIELTIFTDSYGIFDTYTYYNKREMNADIKAFEKLNIELIEA